MKMSAKFFEDTASLVFRLRYRFLGQIAQITIMLAVSTFQAAAFTQEELICPALEDLPEGSQKCPCKPGWTPSPAELNKILKDHKMWLDRGGTEDPKVPGRAVLCEADVHNIDLKKVNLEHANFESSNLMNANFAGADISFANFRDARLMRANFRNSRIQTTDFNGADLHNADFHSAHMMHVRLERASLISAILDRANLHNAKLISADLRNATLKDANLNMADLSNANLENAKLQGANFVKATLSKARIAFTDLSGAIYAPISEPPENYLTGIAGLATVAFPHEQQSGLVQLRHLLRLSGLRQLEREATYAIEYNIVASAALEGSPGQQLGGMFRWAFFGWTTGWGLYPGHALVIMLVIMFIYAVPIAAQ